jgi:hypothetical protein
LTFSTPTHRSSLKKSTPVSTRISSSTTFIALGADIYPKPRRVSTHHWSLHLITWNL